MKAKGTVFQGVETGFGLQGAVRSESLLFMASPFDSALCRLGDAGPKTDSIEVQECESNVEPKEWLKQHAPAFLTLKRYRGAPNRA
jgi:hypothetical protein